MLSNHSLRRTATVGALTLMTACVAAGRSSLPERRDPGPDRSLLAEPREDCTPHLVVANAALVSIGDSVTAAASLAHADAMRDYLTCQAKIPPTRR